MSKCFENFVSQVLGVLTRIYAAELRLYKESDPFLCFAVPGLSEAGVLKIGDDKEREYYE